MFVTGTTPDEIHAALATVNRTYGGNLRLAKLQPRRHGFLVRLGVSDCRGPGARRGFCRNKDGQRRRSSSACWHAHGDFIDALPPAASIHVTTRYERTLPEHGGDCRWVDWQVGSMADPAFMSELCDCEEVAQCA